MRYSFKAILSFLIGSALFCTFSLIQKGIIGSPLTIETFLFPFLNVYTFRALGTLASLILGIAVFMTGVIYEMRFIVWYSSAWWIGAILMAISDSPYRFLIMIAVIIIGWVLPGFIINKKYKNGSKSNEA